MGLGPSHRYLLVETLAPAAQRFGAFILPEPTKHWTISLSPGWQVSDPLRAGRVGLVVDLAAALFLFVNRRRERVVPSSPPPGGSECRSTRSQPPA